MPRYRTGISVPSVYCKTIVFEMSVRAIDRPLSKPPPLAHPLPPTWESTRRAHIPALEPSCEAPSAPNITLTVRIDILFQSSASFRRFLQCGSAISVRWPSSWTCCDTRLLYFVNGPTLAHHTLRRGPYTLWKHRPADKRGHSRCQNATIDGHGLDVSV